MPINSPNVLGLGHSSRYLKNFCLQTFLFAAATPLAVTGKSSWYEIRNTSGSKLLSVEGTGNLDSTCQHSHVPVLLSYGKISHRPTDVRLTVGLEPTCVVEQLTM